MPAVTTITVEDAIHRRWATDSRLCALLPIASLTTGPAQGEQAATDDDGVKLTPLAPLPNGQLTRTANTLGFRSSSGRGDAAAVRLQFWCNNKSTGDALTIEVYRVFDSADWSDGIVLINNCEVGNDYFLQEDDGVWQFVIDLQIEAQVIRV